MIWIRRLGSLLVIALITLLLLEAVLQAGALVVRWSGRDSADAETWPVEGLKVLALGDSNTYGLYLPLEQAWPARFEALWNAGEPARPVSVLNLAYPGTNSFRVRANMARFLGKTEPDWVFVMIGNNDFWTPAEDADALSAAADAQHWRRWLARHSRTYRLLFMLGRSTDKPMVYAGHRMVLDQALLEGEGQQRVLDTLAAEVQAATDKVKRMAPKRPDVLFLDGEPFDMMVHTEAAPAGLKRLPDNLRAILASADKAGAKAVLLTYPTSNHFYPGASRRIRETAAATGTPLIDLEAHFRGLCAGDAACPAYFLADAAHPNAAGYEAAALYIRGRFADILAADGAGVAP